MKKGFIVIFLIIAFELVGIVYVNSYSTLQEYENSINYSCKIDSDCEIKDVHNCCGYYPKCTNKDAIVDSAFVKSACENESIVGICGFPSIDYCKCENNTCVPGASTNITQLCGDSDGGKNYYAKGITSRGGNVLSEDYCVNNKTLRESYCLSGLIRTEEYLCDIECKDGVCVGKQNESNSYCKNLYWFDDINKSCGVKQFCGLYMYQELQTFESREECLQALGVNFSEGCTPEECGLQKRVCPSIGTPNCPIGSESESVLDENNCTKAYKCVKTLSNGRNAEIKIMPETAFQIAIERLGELGFSVSLKEVGRGDDSKLVYELTGNKQGKFLGIFKIMARVQAQVDAETGNVKVIKPWWSFLASGI